MQTDHPDVPADAPVVHRRPYTPPLIEQVRIVPEEAILVSNCKTSPVGPGGTFGCGTSPGCSGVGS